LSGLPNLECLEFQYINFDLKQCDPFVNAAKLRRLRIKECSIENLELDFFTKFSNLEKLDYYTERQPFQLQSLTYLKNLKHLKLKQINSLNSIVHKFKSLEFLKEMTNLVICELNFSCAFTIEEDTFKGLNKLEHLRIHANKGKWMRYLTNLKSLDLVYLSPENNEETVDYFEYLANLGILKINYSYKTDVVRSNEFKALRNLKTFCLIFEVEKKIIEENAFAGLDELTELDISSSVNNKLSLKSDSFKGLSNLRKLSVAEANNMDDDFLHNFPNLLILQISGIRSFKLTEQTFSKNLKLKKLEISLCEIETLPDNVFANLTNLTHLSLYGNNIEMFNESAFIGLENLIELYTYFHDKYQQRKFNSDVLDKMPGFK
jgi:hypothetical protein